MSKFQFIVISVFIVCIIAGVIAFATYKGSGKSSSLPNITVWGTFPADVFDKYISEINNKASVTLTVIYVQKKPEQFSGDFIAALAKGTGPDAVLIPLDMLLPHLDKLTLVPYTTLTQRTFMDTYIEESNIYLTDNGILAMPFIVDPLIMYWNRDMFNASSIATYPKYWDEFNLIIPKLTVRDSDGNVRKSTLAMGDFTNITNARELVGSLLMQLNNPVTAYDGQSIKTTIAVSSGSAPQSVFKFFTQFVDPSSPNYSWNRGMPNDKTAFLSGIGATYFGFASEIKDIRAKNPNLNFDAAALPQVRTGGIKSTFGKMYGFSFMKSSPNLSTAYQAVSTLVSPTYLPMLVDMMYLPSIRRDIIAQGSTDPYIDVFNQSALVANGWLDIEPSKARQILSSTVQDITSGKVTVIEAVGNIEEQYNVLLKEATQ
ncbi:MAG: extracellular solute-binding protein [Candidatus Taylorbacteria bacterium]